MKLRWTHWWIVGAMLGTAACGGGMGTDGGSDGATDAHSEAGADAHPDGSADAGQDVAMDHATPDVPGDTGMDASDVTVTEAGPDATPEAGPDGDVDAGPDGATKDGGSSDGGTSDGGTSDGGTVTDICAAPINLNTAGTLTGATTDYVGTNASAPAAVTLIADSTACTTNISFGLAYSYTTRGPSVLRVSTDNAGTPDTFDTVVFALDHCSATATELGCDDDAHVDPRARASTFTTSPLAAGTTVTVVVAQYGSGDTTPDGAFELTVTELPVIPLGGTCDPTGATNACVAASTCVGSGATGTCVADGASGGACRSSAPECDAGLACDSNGTTSICVPEIPSGGACDPAGLLNLCAGGISCVTNGSASTCIADGASNGLCRSGDPNCDTGLACNGDPGNAASRCVTAVADGGACDPTGVANVCTAPAVCVTTGASPVCGHPTYAESALASPTWIDACAMGTSLEASLAGDTDDGHTPVQTLPFTFPFYGMQFTQLWPDTNGYAVLGANAPQDVANGTIPQTDEGPVVAPFWDDLMLNATGSDLCVATVGTAPARSYVIEWLHATRYSHTSVDVTFEAILHEDTHAIDYLYHALGATDPADADYANGNQASIGVQSNAGGLSVVHTGTVSTTTGIRLTPM